MKKRQPKTEVLRVRLSKHEQQKLESFAERHEQTISHVIREYIRRLPNSTEQPQEL